MGFLAQADHLAHQLASGAIAPEKLGETRVLIFNAQLDAAVTALFMVVVSIVVLDVACVWWQTLPLGARRRAGGGCRHECAALDAGARGRVRPGARGVRAGLRRARGDPCAARRRALEERCARRRSCC